MKCKLRSIAAAGLLAASASIGCAQTPRDYGYGRQGNQDDTRIGDRDGDRMGPREGERRTGTTCAAEIATTAEDA